MLATDPGQARAEPSREAFDAATSRIFAIAEAAQSVPGASPALAVVAVRGEGPPRIWVEGRIEAEGDLAADADTPFYIASMTKAYVGLLAAELDRRGVMPLDTTLDQIWPGLAIADAPNAGTVTMRDLLSHRIPFRNDTLSFRTAYTDEPPAGAFRAILETFSTPHEGKFDYSNLGYLIYGAAVETKTGRHWRRALVEDVLLPLELHRTSPFPSRFPKGTAAGGHQWLLDGFQPAPLKADPLMHAAGGLVASPGDMARWLQSWLRGEGGGIPALSYTLAKTTLSFGEQSNEGIDCTGYALGWHVCDIGGATVRLHGGGYTGVRSVMAWSEDLDAGFAVLSNSDSMTGGLSAQMTRMFFSALADPAFEPPSPDVFAQRYAEMVRGLAEGRQRNVDERMESADWGGWHWNPNAAELAAYLGPYEHPRLGRLTLAREGEQLVARLGEMRLVLKPAAPDLFGAFEGLLDPPGPVRFERDSSGRPDALVWQDERFVRPPA